MKESNRINEIGRRAKRKVQNAFYASLTLQFVVLALRVSDKISFDTAIILLGIILLGQNRFNKYVLRRQKIENEKVINDLINKFNEYE